MLPSRASTWAHRRKSTLPAFDEEGTRGGFLAPDQAGLATAVWAPVEPTLAVETELADFDEYEVRVYDFRRGRRLVAAVEIISPANKDRAENRHQFTAKCAALLRRGCRSYWSI